MRDRRHFAEYPGLSLLLQGRACVEHLSRAEECGREGCADVFRLMERMVARSVAADRGRPARRGRADRKSGIESACFFIARPRFWRPGDECPAWPALLLGQVGIT